MKVADVGYEVEDVEWEPADAEYGRDGAEEYVGALQAATTQLAAGVLISVVCVADETGSEAVAQLVGNSDVCTLMKKQMLSI